MRRRWEQNRNRTAGERTAKRKLVGSFLGLPEEERNHRQSETLRTTSPCSAERECKPYSRTQHEERRRKYRCTAHEKFPVFLSPCFKFLKHTLYIFILFAKVIS